MPAAKMWNGTAWVDFVGSVLNMVTTDTTQTISGAKDFTTTPTINSRGITVTDLASPFIQRGSFTITFASGVASGTVNFTTAFSGTPIVVANLSSITGNTTATINVNSATASAFSWRAQQQASGTTYNGSVTGWWIAVGQI